MSRYIKLLYDIDFSKKYNEEKNIENRNEIGINLVNLDVNIVKKFHKLRTIINNVNIDVSRLTSNNNTSDGGFTIGEVVEKFDGEDPDMKNSSYTNEFDPDVYPKTKTNSLFIDENDEPSEEQITFTTDIFPDMAPFSGNIVSPLFDTVDDNGDPISYYEASYWNDWGGDIFDDFGYFYLYDIETSKYYFLVLNPQNTDDGIINTQIFNAFGRQFTVKHGYPVQGIFKLDISVNDNKPFKFGEYGNMGSDGNTFSFDLSQNYTKNSQNLTLYYHKNSDSLTSSNETFYSYFIPRLVSQNASKTYDAYYEQNYVSSTQTFKNDDELSLMSKNVNYGLLVYHSKTNDVKNWVINDLNLS
jgi:hypothetical protein